MTFMAHQHRRGFSAALFLGVCAVALVMGGCQTPLPTFAEEGGDAVLATARERQAGVRTVQSAATVMLMNAEDRVLLDGALVAMPPGSLRLKGWKFGRSVFDATWIDGELWLVSPEGRDGGEEDAARVRRGLGLAMEVLGNGFYEAARVVHDDGRGPVIAEARSGELRIRCELDRATRTARQFEVLHQAGGGEASGQVELSEYRVVSEIAWPTRIRIESGAGSIVIRMRGVELNGELSAQAFRPPARAVRTPSTP